MPAPKEGASTALAAVPRFTAWVALGGNLGDVPATFAAALSQLAGLPGTGLLGVSALYHTAPWEAQGPQFTNAVAALHTALGAEELLGAMLRTEALLGRARPYVNAPRTLDLDLLALGDRQSATPFLMLPHPRAHQRAFVLAPWAELQARLRQVGLRAWQAAHAGDAPDAPEPSGAPYDPGAPGAPEPWPALPPAATIAALCAEQGAAEAFAPLGAGWLQADPAGGWRAVLPR